MIVLDELGHTTTPSREDLADAVADVGVVAVPYRLLDEGKDLPAWHHLVSGSRNTIHEQGRSVRGATDSEEGVAEPDLVKRIVVWPGEPGAEN